MTWRMAKVAGAIDTTVRLPEAVIQTRLTFKIPQPGQVLKQ
jgi:hypothetical protein